MTGDTPPFPDEMWRRFLDDDEQAIRRTAMREPSARERALGAGLPLTHDTAKAGSPALVGQAWQPMPRGGCPRGPRQERGSRQRRAQLGRAAGCAALLLLFLGTVGRGPGGSAPANHPGAGNTQLKQSEATPDPQPTLSTPTSRTPPSRPELPTGNGTFTGPNPR